MIRDPGSLSRRLAQAGSWQEAGLAVSVDEGVVLELELPQVLVSKACPEPSGCPATMTEKNIKLSKILLFVFCVIIIIL